MKIALVSPYDYPYPGGVTSHIAHLEHGLSRRGHDVRIIAPSSAAGRDARDSKLIAIGRPYPIPARGSIARITLSLRLAGRVKRVLRDEAFDIVHLHEPLVPALPITVLRFSNAVNVGTFHAYADSSMAYHYGRPILRRWFRRLHGKIAVSRAAMEFVSQYFPGYYNIIPNGIDYEFFARERPPISGLDDGKLNILFVGRPEKRKGLKYLIRAYALLKRQMPNIRLVVVGPRGGLHERYRHSVEASGLEDVIFTGFVPYEDLPRYYQSAHVFCSPATGHESFGIVLLEAMAGRSPVVCSNIGGFSDLVRDGVDGILTPPKDSVALAAAIGSLLRDPERRRVLAENANRRACEYSWERIAGRVEAYYLRLMNEFSEEMIEPASLRAGVRPAST